LRVEFQGDFFVWEMELEEREGGRTWGAWAREMGILRLKWML